MNINTNPVLIIFSYITKKTKPILEALLFNLLFIMFGLFIWKSNFGLSEGDLYFFFLEFSVVKTRDCHESVFKVLHLN